MQYELRQQVIEPRRQAFTPLVRRFGDRPATRYEEGSIGIQPRANFHYRPLWDPEHEMYDERFSALRLSDPDSYTDPRQYYYTPYVIDRAALHDAFGRNLSYVSDRGLLAAMPAGWHSVITSVLLPLRYYESGAQLISVSGARYAYGTTIEQCLSFAAFDRIGNAQMISRIGIALGGNTDSALVPTKPAWLDENHLQGLRRLIEESLVGSDWARSVLALDLCDRLLYPLLTRHLDEVALLEGGGPYSLLTQQLGIWFVDHRKWIDALITAWTQDIGHGEANAGVLRETIGGVLPQCTAAVLELAAEVDRNIDCGAALFVEKTADQLIDALRCSGIEPTGV